MNMANPNFLELSAHFLRHVGEREAHLREVRESNSAQVQQLVANLKRSEVEHQ